MLSALMGRGADLAQSPGRVPGVGGVGLWYAIGVSAGCGGTLFAPVNETLA